MIITTTDPVTGEHLHNLASKPFIIEGEGCMAVKIYFESEENRSSYIHSCHNNNEASVEYEQASSTV